MFVYFVVVITKLDSRITERLLSGRKESNQTKTKLDWFKGSSLYILVSFLEVNVQNGDIVWVAKIYFGVNSRCREQTIV